MFSCRFSSGFVSKVLLYPQSHEDIIFYLLLNVLKFLFPHAGDNPPTTYLGLV